jgi:hypothetical protein
MKGGDVWDYIARQKLAVFDCIAVRTFIVVCNDPSHACCVRTDVVLTVAVFKYSGDIASV